MMKQFSYRHTKEAELMDSMEQAAKGAPQTLSLIHISEPTRH